MRTGSVVFSATAKWISTKLSVWMDTLCTSIHLKSQVDQGPQHRVTGLSFPYRGLSVKRSGCQSAKCLGKRCAALRHFLGDASGIEVHSIKSRCEAPWMQVHSTKAFKLTGRSAQHRVKVRSALD